MNSDETTSVVLAGVGGQGILLASEILAKAAMNAGFDVKTNEVHGMAQRGGSVIAQIRWGKTVYSPLVQEGTAVVVAALEQIEAIRFAHYLAPGGTAISSTQAIIPVTVSSGQGTYPANAQARLKAIFPRLVLIDADALARQAGTIKAANVVILGAVAAALDLPLEAWQKAIEQSVKSKHLALNLKAFELGRQCVA